MTKVNFDHINGCPVDSDIIDESGELMLEHFSDPNSFHAFGRASKAKIEESRNFFAESLNILPNELFFTNDSVSQTKQLISYCILILNIEHIITSAYENESILDYLKALAHNKKIKLSIIPTSKIGEVNLQKIKALLNESLTSLLSLSHANEYNGLLLPVKDILQLCKENNVLFHLNIKPTIGKYHIDIQKIKADFITFDFSSSYGSKNVGCFFINQSIKIEDNLFHQLKKTLKNSEFTNVGLISVMHKVFLDSANNLQKHQEQIKKLREYFISEFINNFDLKHVLAAHNKEGLYTILTYYLKPEQFGKHITEKLDINNITVGRVNYPESITAEKGEYLRFSFGKENTISDINFLISVLKEIHQ